MGYFNTLRSTERTATNLFVILEDYAGLRTQLNGTRYLANPKVVSMAIGKLGAARAINGGVVISVIFSLGFHALDQLRRAGQGQPYT